MLSYEIMGIGACLADGAKIRVTAILSNDIAELLPYVNAVVKYATFDQGGLTITFKYRGSPVILGRRRVVVGQLNDLDAAEDLLDGLIEFLSRVMVQRDSIQPVYTTKPLPQPMQIIKFLPRSNCGRCGESACTAFALKLVLEQQQVENCPFLSGDEIRIVMSIISSLNHEQLINYD